MSAPALPAPHTTPTAPPAPPAPQTAGAGAGAGVDEAAVHALVRDWYAALDRHEDVSGLLRMLAPQGLVMQFPEGTIEGIEGFSLWYETVTHLFFDEIHDITAVHIEPPDPAPGAGGVPGAGGELVRVGVEVRWQTRRWMAPAATSQWLGFDAAQSWTLTPAPDGSLRILTYRVDSLTPLPGSAPL
ncbi:nuclear transport factor 2 family protein [Streptomyces purpureus]|uniref:nuclear transport factor 2 family protein n=1 Tax=Streptomyces purpureus TaxID=1951 RepID=UPI0003777285|nr:nuclear transport factor 2 family protein [Streptomyces purpureus]